ncbi:MAG TPA: diguanylate cyclase [Actinomycetes bacterium]|nr:diguanylate cyclase [Actinomycetes bacterium]
MRVSVKGYLAILVTIFVVGLLAVSLVNRRLAGDLGAVLDAITHRNYPKATAARELVRAKLTEQNVEMPHLDGHAVLSAIKGEAELADIPVVFVTSRVTTEDVVEGLRLGAHDYLRKPFEASELLARVHAAVRQVNDRRGHAAGDEVLRVVAGRLGDAARPGDLPGRWGGEEFLVVLPDTMTHQAAALGEQVRAAIGASPVPLGGDPLRVTVSVGVASGTEDGWDGLVRRADSGLYAAKEAGRDRVVAGPAAARQPRWAALPASPEPEP